MKTLSTLAALVPLVISGFASPVRAEDRGRVKRLTFDVRSVKDGKWSDAATWKPARVPRAGERVIVTSGTRVEFDVVTTKPIRLLQVAGTLAFSRTKDTQLDCGIIKIQGGEDCSESGFACDFHNVNAFGEPILPPKTKLPTLEVGTRDRPIPAGVTARVRLHHFQGMNVDDAPALVCCSGRMEIHGAPLSRTWDKLGADANPGDRVVTLAAAPTGWRSGDEILVTGSERKSRARTFRGDPDSVASEVRRIVRIDGARIELDKPLEEGHWGSGIRRSEVANLSRNVVIESADPEGARGHTIYHRFSHGGLSFARFAHLGKERTLGRYAIHFHLVGDTMRGAEVRGVAIVDSHNRWITVHGTQYLVVRDCVGYGSVGHGFFLEDGTEVYNLFDRNLAVQAYRGRRIPKQVMRFDPNDGAAFWWANGRNAFVRNVTCENDEYGYRYDSQMRSNFDSRLSVLQPDGTEKTVDIRKIPMWLFRDNEAHTEGLYAYAFSGTDGEGPDVKHPHHLKGLRAWEVHYALRAQLPTMWIEDVDIDGAAYGIYRPWFDNHVYRNLRIANTAAEPFNRGLDDRSTQHGSITVDGLTFGGKGYGRSMPLIQISANNLSGKAASHFRRVRIEDRKREPRPLVNLGGGPRLDPKTERSVPVYLHDWYGVGRHAEIVSTRAKDVKSKIGEYREDRPLTGDESRVREVSDVEFPELLAPIDDSPPASVILGTQRSGDRVLVEGVSFDNTSVARVAVSGVAAKLVEKASGVVYWSAEIPTGAGKSIEVRAHATDAAGNTEQNSHRLSF